MPTLTEIGIHAQRFVNPIVADTITKVYCTRLGKSRKLSDKLKFAKDYKIDFRKTRKCSKNDTLETCLEKFPTLNDFFARELKPEFLKIDSRRKGSLISPAECMARKISAVKDGEFSIKGANYTMEKLLRTKQAPLEATIFIFRLAPEHYHRIHSPCASTIKNIRSVGGHYLSVNPILLNRNPILQENYRKIITFTNGMIMVAVGASCVGTVDLSVHRGDRVKKGQDLGCFKFGGSCIVLILPEPMRIEDCKLTTEERFIEVGSFVGVVV